MFAQCTAITHLLYTVQKWYAIHHSLHSELTERLEGEMAIPAMPQPGLIVCLCHQTDRNS